MRGAREAGGRGEAAAAFHLFERVVAGEQKPHFGIVARDRTETGRSGHAVAEGIRGDRVNDQFGVTSSSIEKSLMLR
ncbi:hypothetical protein [Cryobacterium ruanii]|uniref:Uncharacterized protein n=1 Tax=Cryobacterium ruanii TaxID=1259197 RepID=A0A4R9AJX1_9MICO|nr:hypothetical protein [Cryobacterium ruanii]TFD62993.1 hypothetical protein E3T47_15045 [Cryobacterium ruanii]